VMLTGQVAWMIGDQLLVIVCLSGGNLVSWRSKKQPVVSKSTAEAEYKAMPQGLSEMLWVRNLLSELKVLRKGPLNLWCDNKSAINIANNPVQHDRTKHVEIDRFFIKEKLDDGIIKISHVTSSEEIKSAVHLVTRWE
jgi:hypothetical protein